MTATTPFPPAVRVRAPRAAWTRVGLPAAGAYAVQLLMQGIQLALLAGLSPKFFWLDDSQAQFQPTWWWMGQNQNGIESPLIDPDLGMAGNFTVDMQYGALDPAHWIIQALMRTTDDLLLMGWVFGAFCVLWLGLGAHILMRQARAAPVLAIACSVGVASSGFFLWFGSSWWPLLWSAAWLPWLWVGLASRGWVGTVVTGVSMWVLLASGNPYIVPFVLLVVIAQLYARRAELGSWRRLVRAPQVIARTVAAIGGVLIAAPTLLTTLQLSPYMDRPSPDAVVGNAGRAIPNLADVLFGGSTSVGMLGFDSPIVLAPAVSTFVLALPLVAFVGWRRAIRNPAVVGLLFVFVGALLATQLPTQLLVFRYPIRYLVYVQVFGALAVVVAVSTARVLSRGRIAVAGALIAVQLYLALSRSPYLVKWHLIAVVLVVVAVLAYLGLARAGGPAWSRSVGVRIGSGIVVVLVSASSVLLATGAMRGLESRVIALSPEKGFEAGEPFRWLPPGNAMGTTVQSFEDQVLAPDAAVTLLTFDETSPADRGWARGVMIGNASLFGGLRTGAGYAAAPQKYYNAASCMDLWGKVYCGDGGVYTTEFADSGATWIDLVARDTVILSPAAPAPLLDHLRTSATWTEDAAPETGWTMFSRVQPLTGRVTLAQGVDVDPSGWVSGMAYRATPEEAYSVSTGDSDGRLTLSVPYWPGYRATLDGAPVEVGALGSALLTVTVPAGTEDGRLEIYYDPVGVRLAPALWAGGAVVIVLAAVLALLLPRLRRRTSIAAAPLTPETAGVSAGEEGP